jgi:hypothetical protein
VLQQITAKGAHQQGRVNRRRGFASSPPPTLARPRRVRWMSLRVCRAVRCVCRWMAGVPAACQGLAVSAQNRLRLGLCGQRQPVGARR